MEHVIDAAARAGRPAGRVPATSRVLATSRAVLRLSGEQRLPRPLALPRPAEDASAGRPSSMPRRSQLFVDARAGGRGPTFALRPSARRGRGAICRRLDGLPLAIELAAARVRVLAPAEACWRGWSARLPLLTGGARDAAGPAADAARHDRLELRPARPEERRALFRRLSVFAGGCTLDAGGGRLQPTIGRSTSSTVLASLRGQEPAAAGAEHRRGEPRFAMLETIREFGLERLAAAGELERIRDAHAGFYLRLAEENALGWETGEEERLTELFDAERGNLRSAIGWLASTGQLGRVARMGLATWQYWWTRGAFEEGMQTMDAVLADPSATTDEERAHASFVLGILALGHTDYRRAAPALLAATELYGQVGERRGAAVASIGLGWIETYAGRETGEPRVLQALATLRELQDDWGLAFGLFVLGRVRVDQGRVDEGVPLLDEAVGRARAVRTQVLLSFTLINLGWANLARGALDAARPPLQEALERAALVDSRPDIARALEALAALAMRSGDADRAARLFGAAEGARRSVGAPIWVPDRQTHQQTEEALRAALGDEAYEAALAGRHPRATRAGSRRGSPP